MEALSHSFPEPAMRFASVVSIALVLCIIACGESREAGLISRVGAKQNLMAPAVDMAGGTGAIASSNEAASKSDAADPVMTAQHVDTTTIPASMIVRTGQAQIEVASVDDASTKIRQLAQRLGGYIANSSRQSGKDQIRSATLEVKLPAPRFDEALSGLNPIGTVESTNVTSEDVGEDYVDVSARLANARRLEQRLIDLLAQRTGKLSDVLSVERELARVREEIERYEGHMRFLRSRAALSTLTVTVHERAPILDQDIGHNPIAEAFKSAWRNFVGFIAAFIASLGVIIPLALLAVLGWLLYLRYIRQKP